MIVASANYTRDVVVERQVAVECHSKNVQLCGEWYNRPGDHSAAGLVEFCDLLASAGDKRFLFEGFSRRLLAMCQPITASTQSESVARSDGNSDLMAV